MNTRKITPILLLLLAGLACSLAGPHPSPPPGTLVGILSRQLDLVEKGEKKTSLQPVGDPVELEAGEMVRVSNGGEGLLDFGDQLQVRLFNDTQTKLVEARNVPGAPLSVRLYLERGGMTGKLSNPGGSFQLRTPGGAQILVLGTRFFVIYNQGITWVGNFEGLLGVVAGGETTQVPSGYYLMVPDAQKPSPALPMPFSQEQLENRSRQENSASAALARLALAGTLPTQTIGGIPGTPHVTIPVIPPLVTETPPPADLTPLPPSDTTPPQTESPHNEPIRTVTALPPTQETVAPYIAVLDPSTEPVGVGRTCPPGAGIVRLKAVVFDPSGVASVTASWSLGTLQGVEELRHNEKGNYVGEIGPLDTPGTMRVTLNAVDRAGNLGSAPPFQVVLSTCPDLSTPVIGVLDISPQVVPGSVCAGTPAPLVLSARISDDGQLGKVIAVWETGGLQHSAEMEPAGDGRFQAALLLDSPAGEVPVHIEAYDAAGNKAGSRSVPLLVEDCQDFPPQIKTINLSANTIAAGKDCPALPGTVTLTAQVVDDRGLEGVTARWTLAESSQEVQLDRIEADLYQVELGPFEAHGILNIQVSAVDTAGQSAEPRRIEAKVTACPDTDGPEVNNISVMPSNVYVDSDCPDPRVVTVTARVTDESQIREVLATWQLGETSGDVVLDPLGDDIYRADLGPFPVVGSYSMRISATDEHSNRTMQEAGSFVVSACEVEQ